MARDYKKLLAREKIEARNAMHSFHRYFGKLIPAIPAFAIKNFTEEGDWVLDSFCGSGTTLLEAKNLGRNAYGTDINPLAVFAAKVKTTKLDPLEAAKAWQALKEIVQHDKIDYSAEQPYTVNIDHWFQPAAKADLLRLRHHILTLPDGDIKSFLLACFSAFLRGVSNADPQHVFPGYSKRLRALDAAGKRKIDVLKSYENAVKKRIKYLELIADNKAEVKIYEAGATKLPRAVKNVKLIVINPPYISSIRYLETMKIEMGWLGFINSQQDYLDLDKKVTGTERFYKQDLDDIGDTGLPGLDKIINELIAAHQPKMAKVVSKYFLDMQAAFREMARVLLPGGHIVIKISDSKVRGHDIATHQYFIDILEGLGLKTLAAFKDDFDPNSRSLLTARNSYSGIMHFDWVLIFQK